ncbi:MAG: diaminopimelate decarboxylase [Alphaproteobacteria bacterium]|nr:diaminopimelate decarboxylase [Alphaproteobacteria bacterium]
MADFSYQNGELYAEAVPLAEIAAAVGTPLYVYSATSIADAYRRFAAAFDGTAATICYALKANSNQAVVRLLAKLGAGADVVSQGELRRALAAGIAPDKIVFSGVGKTRDEMDFALGAGVGQFNVESEPELDALAEIATARGRAADIAIRVNPDIDVETHAKIATGLAENKFGVDISTAPEIFAKAASLPGINVRSIAVHIGSQLVSLEPFAAAFAAVADLRARLAADGIPIDQLDLGGGLGIAYRSEPVPDVEAYAGIVRDTVGNLGCGLIFEPGRSIVGNGGILLTSVIYRKEGKKRRWLVVDAAMNDLLRPSLYGAYHAIRPVREAAHDAMVETFDVVGPICETGDTFALARELPVPAPGDLLAFEGAGAYGAVMASTYNSRPIVAEVLVEDDRWAVVHPRQTIDDMVAQDEVPPWI